MLRGVELIEEVAPLGMKHPLVNGGGRGFRLIHFFDHGIGKLRGPGLTADILREFRGVPVDFF